MILKTFVIDNSDSDPFNKVEEHIDKWPNNMIDKVSNATDIYQDDLIFIISTEIFER